jgi:hypothetical protein
MNGKLTNNNKTDGEIETETDRETDRQRRRTHKQEEEIGKTEGIDRQEGRLLIEPIKCRMFDHHSLSLSLSLTSLSLSPSPSIPPSLSLCDCLNCVD